MLDTPNGMCAFLSHSPHNIATALNTRKLSNIEREQALRNRQQLIAPFLLEDCAFLDQEHGDTIVFAQKGGFLGKGDGILIIQKGIIGLIMVADCNPILLFDTKQHILILLHGGRVGLQKGILPKAIALLKERFHTKAQDLFVFVGPSIRACCYEVQEEIFRDSVFLDYKRLRDGKLYLDLVAMIQAQLKEQDITNFTISPHCTRCDSSYFSYRSDSSCGRFGLFAYLV